MPRQNARKVIPADAPLKRVAKLKDVSAADAPAHDEHNGFVRREPECQMCIRDSVFANG